MHYALVAVVIVWFVFLAPIRVVAVTSVGCFLIAASVRAVASALSGMQISYGTAIKAVFLSVFLLLITMLMIAGGLSHFSLLTLVVLNPLVVLVSLFGAYVLGYPFASAPRSARALSWLSCRRWYRLP